MKEKQVDAAHDILELADEISEAVPCRGCYYKDGDDGRAECPDWRSDSCSGPGYSKIWVQKKRHVLFMQKNHGKLVAVSTSYEFKIEDVAIGILDKFVDGKFYVLDNPVGYLYCRLVQKETISAHQLAA